MKVVEFSEAIDAPLRYILVFTWLTTFDFNLDESDVSTNGR